MAPFPEVPVIETERLLMRGRTASDFSFFAYMWADERVTRHITKEPQTTSETWGKFLRAAGHWALMGYGYWVVEAKDTNELIGEVGFGEFKRDFEPSLFGQPEIGWVLAASGHGKGYATEAARAAIAWGDVFFDAGKMSCIIEPAHATSIKVAEKCGFKESFRTFDMDDELMILHREIQAR